MAKAMIFAAGLGTRLKPLTDRMPKALVPVGGKPLLQTVLDRLVTSGYDDIVVNVHHFAAQITDYLSALDMPGVRISISDESGMLRNTGGGIQYAEPLLGNGNFLVHNVDIISDLDLRKFAASVRDEAVATLAVSSRRTSRYLLFDEGMRLVGWTNTATGEVRSPFPDLNPDSCRKYAFAGIHLLTHKVFRLFREFGFEGSFPVMDFYLKAAGKYPVCGYVQEPLEIIDAGKPETLSLARDFLLRHGDILPQNVQEDDHDKQTCRNQDDVLPCAEKF